MARQRRRYDDKFRASAVVMLEATGYPEVEGGLTQTAKHLGIPLNTLKGWFTAERNPPPAKLRNQKKQDLVIELENVAHLLVKAMPGKIDEASLQQIATSMAIAIDKMQLLKGQPTWRGEIIELIKQGIITPEQAENELGSELATELFNSIGVSIAGVREAQTQSAEIE
jgi:transposase-like protein